MKRLHHVDVTMSLTSSGVVIGGLPGKGLSFLLPDCRNMFTDDKLIVHYIQNYVARQQHVHLLQNVKTLYLCIICRQPRWHLKLANTEISPDNCNRNNSLSISNSIWENKPAGLPQHVHVVYFEIWLLQSRVLYNDLPIEYCIIIYGLQVCQ